MRAYHLAPVLLDADWYDAFDTRSIRRGLDYAKQGRVQDLDYEPNDQHPHGVLHGHVLGSQSYVYECQAHIEPSADDKLQIRSRCTCPVHTQCKHAVAMLMTAQASKPPAATATAPMRKHAAADPSWQAWEQWLTRLDAPTAHTHRIAAERRFGLLLSGSESGQLLALPAWLRPAKNKTDAWVAPQAITLSQHHGATPVPINGWDPADLNALALLLHVPQTRIRNQPWRAIASRPLEQALEHLLSRHPAWFERGSQGIERGADLVPEPVWREDPTGKQRLILQVQPDLTHCHILKAAHHWYIDLAQHTYGRVAYDPALLDAIERMPALDPEQAGQLSRRLAAHPRTAKLPAPTVHAKGKDIRSAPIPVLRLYVEQVQEAWSFQTHRIGCAIPAFDYGGIVIDAVATRPRMQRLHQGKLHTIHIKPKAEKAHIQTLAECGLISLEMCGLYEVEVRRDLPPWSLLVRQSDPEQMPDPPEAWQDTIEELTQRGFRVEFSDDFPHMDVLDVDDWYGQLEPSDAHWFDLSLGIEVDGQHMDLMPILRQLVADPRFPRTPAANEAKDACWRVALGNHRCLELPLARLRTLLEPLLEWLETEHEGPARIHATQAGMLESMPLPWQGGEALRKHLASLQQARKPAKTPRGFKATLRPYQQDGLGWLNFLGRTGLGGILADDMGLGKTVQVLAHIVAEKQARRLPHPALVVAPTSLVGNWAAETARFAPRLKVLVIHGANRAERFAQIDQHDLIITTYPLLPRDAEQWQQHRFSLLVLDEAQAIKNARSQAAQTVREISASRRLAMTGTPLENHLGELWAQFDAVEPGLLGSQRQFKRHYRTPIEKHGNAERQQQLNRRTAALLLRRRKDDVLTDLPPKNEITRTLELEGPQRELYETLRLAQHERVREAIKKRGMAQSGIIILDALLKLRQACCDPRLVKLASAHKVKKSAKLEALLELVTGLAGEGRRILLFSQFTAMLGLIETALTQRGIAFQTLTGQTPGKKRAGLVQTFQDGAVPVFLISLKAGGVGLNLTAADTVIHYDPWWNPAVEAQATDRAHRIGQDKPVFVYRLICASTIEEKIQALQAKKADLAKAVLEGGSSKKLRFDEADLEALFGTEAPPGTH